MERPLKNFDYSKYPNMPQSRVPFDSLVIGQFYRVAILRPGGDAVAEYIGDGNYRFESGSVYSDFEIDAALSLVIPIFADRTE